MQSIVALLAQIRRRLKRSLWFDRGKLKESRGPGAFPGCDMSLKILSEVFYAV